MVFPVVGGTQLTGDFVTNSLRLNDDDSPYLERSLSSPNTDKFTVSCWVKLCGGRSQIANIGKRLTGEAGDNRSIDIEQGSTGRLGISAYNGVADSNVAAYNSNTGEGPLIRDPSAWYHFVYAFDTGQGTAANRFKWYINGVLQSGYNTTTTPSQNADLFDSSGSGFRLGRAYNTESRYADMYVAEYYYVDGQQYDHTYFGEFNDNGVWVPVENGKGAGGTITFGTNGFYLQFKQTGTSANSSGIGADTSGNDNHLTPTNLAALDITTDTPQNNFATMNPLDTGGGGGPGQVTFAEGNTQITANNNHSAVRATQGFRNGKWYWEVKVINISGQPAYGIMTANANMADQQNATGTRWYKADSGNKITDTTSTSYGNSYAANDIIGVAVDMDNGAIYFSKNGTFQNSGDPTSGSSKTGAAFTDLLTATTEHWLPAIKQYGEGASVNFGNPSFSISSGNTDGLYGNFEYAPPSGYYALSTKRLAEFG